MPYVVLGPLGDHPRIRGEHENGTGMMLYGNGIIPAYAGSTQNRSMFAMHHSGSSPHTRGARLPSCAIP